jgi:uncharacterized protein YdiU (UPF0061 family)
LQDGLKVYAETYSRAERANIAAKLGLVECRDEDVALMQDLYEWMAATEIDMTIFFRVLSDLSSKSMISEPFRDAFYEAGSQEQGMATLQEWLDRYAGRLRDDPESAEQRREHMRATNPKYVLRNWLAQQAIDKAAQGDESEIQRLLDVMRHPYDDQPGKERYAARRPDWARNKAGCSMLSCSS